RSGPDSDCAAEVCVEGDGAACPPGQVCRDRACQPKAPARASCGGKRCPAEKPICRWADAARTCLTTGEAQAASEGPAFVDGDFSLYSCTNPADCGQGSQCCTGMVEGARLTRCGRCDVSNSQVVCQRRADCFEICDLFEDAVRDACRKNIKCEGIGRGIKGCSNF
ncbi:MAG TPA: hypothetical protein VFS00_18700, partial [Polyangiaceae bacterium]|nr:hypothetical protein [Polyangiaceae bacterium]